MCRAHQFLVHYNLHRSVNPKFIDSPCETSTWYVGLQSQYLYYFGKKLHHGYHNITHSVAQLASITRSKHKLSRILQLSKTERLIHCRIHKPCCFVGIGQIGIITVC